ncbi:hypothetical protein KAU33_05630 [Candidatus Dependentiae bacterium]|nr:hypothetical protein [Candidatus Dependentiae bacterium]
MDLINFRRFLKKKGKKKHVADYLIQLVSNFEDYLQNEHSLTIDQITPTEIETYLKHIKGNKEISEKQVLRSLSLYFVFNSQIDMARYTDEMREKKIARTRKSFKLIDFQGVDKAQVKKLKKFGIENVNQMLEL